MKLGKYLFNFQAILIKFRSEDIQTNVLSHHDLFQTSTVKSIH